MLLLLLLLLLLFSGQQAENGKKPGKTRKYLEFFGYFRVLPALDAGDRRGSLPGLSYCCSAGLTLATVVGEPHSLVFCCYLLTLATLFSSQRYTALLSSP